GAPGHHPTGGPARAPGPPAPHHAGRRHRCGVRAGGSRPGRRHAPPRAHHRRRAPVVRVVLHPPVRWIARRLERGLRHRRAAPLAAVFCSLGFEVAKRLYALYVTRFATLDRVASDANVVALLLFLLWVYYTAYLFLLGGEVAETYDLIRMRRSQRVQLG